MNTDTNTETTNSLRQIDYEGNLAPVVSRLCEEYSAGDPILYHEINPGYDDYNLYVETNTGKYVAKIFSKDRDPEEITRYVETMEKIITTNKSQQRLLKTKDSGYVYKDGEANNISMILLTYVEGEPISEFGRLVSAVRV